MPRSITVLAFLLFVPLAGCDDIVGGSASLVDAALVVDPTPRRAIRYHAPSPRAGSGELTTRLTAEIECLHTVPRECTLSDFIRVRVQNRGERPLAIRDPVACRRPLHRLALGVWNAMSSGICSTVGGSTPVVVLPGHSHDVAVSVSRADAGTYRVRLPLESADGPLSDALRTSPSFAFQPFPDFEPFVCPTEDLSHEAPHLARELVEQAVAGTLNRGAQTQILRYEARIPGFAYAYLDAGTPVVQLAGWAREAGSDSLAVAEFGADVRLETVEFSMSEVVAWSLLAADHLWRIPALATWGASENHNQVSIRVDSPLARSKVECVASGIGMPEGMLRIQGGLAGM